METCTATGKSFHANGPAIANPASASMIIDLSTIRQNWSVDHTSADALVPPKPVHRVLEDTEVLSDVNSLQQAAGS